MINIFICEDQAEQRDRLTKVIRDYVLMENFDMEVILSTPNPYDLLKCVEEKKIVDGLYFLDINLGVDINGIELAVKVREYDKRGMIVFVTANPDLIKLTYKYHVEAIAYIVKGDVENMEQEIKLCIDLGNKRLVENQKRMFVFKMGDRILSEPYSNILYFEKSVNNKNKVVMQTKNGSFEFLGTLKEIENTHESFCRVGGSCVFNRDNIKALEKTGESKVLQ